VSDEHANRRVTEDVRPTRRSLLRWLGAGAVGVAGLFSGFPNFRRFSRTVSEGGSPLEAINSLALPEEAAASTCYAQYAGFCSGICEGGNCQIATCQGSGNCQGAGPCQGAGDCQSSVCQGSNCQSGDCQGGSCQGAQVIFMSCGGQIEACQCEGNHTSCTVHIQKVLAALREKGLMKPSPTTLTARTFGLTTPKTVAQMQPTITRNLALLRKQGFTIK
jgi:hypothetical protein